MRSDKRLAETTQRISELIAQLGWQFADLKVFFGYPGANWSYSGRKYKDSGKKGLRLQLYVGHFWLETVWQQGLAVLENQYLCLDARKMEFPPNVVADGGWETVLLRARTRKNGVDPKQMTLLSWFVCRVAGITRVNPYLMSAYEEAVGDIHEALTGIPKVPF